MESIIQYAVDFVHSVIGILVAITALLGSIAFLIDTISRLYEKIAIVLGKRGTEMKHKKMARPVTTALGIVLLAFGGGILLLQATTEPLPPNAKLTNGAWEAFNRQNYQEAISKAEQCIEQFGPSALREQRELERNNTPSPPEGKVSEEVKRTIINRGLLNDVATCWFIKGWSLERQKKNSQAMEAYDNAAGFTYARTWDPSWGGFWSPSKAATDRAANLKEK